MKHLTLTVYITDDDKLDSLRVDANNTGHPIGDEMIYSVLKGLVTEYEMKFSADKAKRIIEGDEG